MSRVYVLNRGKEEIERSLPEGLTVVHRPTGHDGRPSLWPYGLTDGKNYGWFEGNMILFWGTNDESPILAKLRTRGVRILDSF